MSSIPLYCLDEHHEAYIAWHETLTIPIKLQSRKLIHIDEHADFGVPFLTRELPNFHASQIEILAATYQELSVGTFLLASNSIGFFDKLSWIRPSKLVSSPSKYYSVRPQSSPPFLILERNPRAGITLEYAEEDWSHTIDFSQPWLLDICLDAFSCNEFPQAKNLILEISESQFLKLSELKLDAWNARYGGLIKLSQKNGKFFFKILEPYQDNSKKIEKKISNAIERLRLFEKWLGGISHPPLVITVARSVITGYTPANLVEYLENSVLKIINQTWSSVVRMDVKRS